jgi:hypothetical protein
MINIICSFANYALFNLYLYNDYIIKLLHFHESNYNKHKMSTI